jgi:hypothetical protein
MLLEGTPAAGARVGYARIVLEQTSGFDDPVLSSCRPMGRE